LVLDGSDGSLGTPVNGVSLRGIQPDGVALGGAVITRHVHGTVLLVSQVSVLVDTYGVGLTSGSSLGVVLGNEGEVVLENGETLGLLSVAAIGLAVVELELKDIKISQDMKMSSLAIS
jgi:hypothetical protein